MSEILIEHLTTSRYAPVTVDAYQYNGLTGLTIGQLIMAVCCRRAAAIENQSVVKMNELSETNSYLEQASDVAQRIFSSSALTAADQSFITDTMGLEVTDFSIDTYAKRVALFDKMKSKIESASTQSQQETIELQSLVSRRDVTYNTSAATVKTLMQSALSMAAAIG